MEREEKIKVNHIPITQARINLGQVVRRAHLDKEYFILEKDGIPIAGIMDILEFEEYIETKLEQEDAQLQAQIRKGYNEYNSGKVRTSDEFFDEIEKEEH